MKKAIIAAVAALFIGMNVNAQSVNANPSTVADVVSELNEAEALQFIPMYQQMLTDIENVCRVESNEDKKTAKINVIKEVYSEKFSDVLITNQNEVAINSIPMDYINERIAK